MREYHVEAHNSQDIAVKGRIFPSPRDHEENLERARVYAKHAGKSGGVVKVEIWVQHDYPNGPMLFLLPEETIKES